MNRTSITPVTLSPINRRFHPAFINPAVSASGAIPARSTSVHFGKSSAEAMQQHLLQGVLDIVPSTASGVNRQALAAAIRRNKALPLPKGYNIQYGVIHPDGKVDSPYPEIKLLAEATWKALPHKPDKPQPLILTVQTPETSVLLEKYIKDSLKKTFAHEYMDSGTRVKHRNVILSDLIEKLISGQATADNVPQEIFSGLRGDNARQNPLGSLYQLTIPGNNPLTGQLGRSAAWPVRQKLLGLDLARKVYAESQEVEWESIALSLVLGVAGEPTINHIFPGGGPVASTIRTTLMSGIDILGNILSVAGVAKENLKERGQSLSFKTVYGPGKTVFDIAKNPWDMKGEAGPLIQQGIKAGGLGGLLGILFNVPAGTILSMPQADIAARSVIGGIGAAGSAVAIPTVIRDTKASYEHSIRALVKEGKIRLSGNIDADSPQGRKFIERMALKELNARIGIASSIKATNPVVLAGTGTIILAGEALGIPREYVQTAYMALAPVMHNFLRLMFTGVEKLWTIPRRMTQLQKLVRESENAPFNERQTQLLDKALLSGMDERLGRGVSSMATALLTGSVLLGAEVLYFLQAFRKSKAEPLHSLFPSSKTDVLPGPATLPGLQTPYSAMSRFQVQPQFYPQPVFNRPFISSSIPMLFPQQQPGFAYYPAPQIAQTTILPPFGYPPFRPGNPYASSQQPAPMTVPTMTPYPWLSSSSSYYPT